MNNAIIDFGTTFNSGLLESLARQAAQRCNDAHGDDAIAAVILAYTALDAFLSEVTELARTRLSQMSGAAADGVWADENLGKPDADQNCDTA